MTRNIKWHRRGILITGGVVAAGMAAYGAAGVIGVARRCSEFGAAADVARIGLAYLRVHPEEASEIRLLAAAASRSALARALNTGPDIAAVFGMMNELVRADFAAGEIVNCSGWILAKSEARACALFALRAAG
jgi:hypothetical protein